MARLPQRMGDKVMLQPELEVSLVGAGFYGLLVIKMLVAIGIFIALGINLMKEG